jgi:Zinc finger, C3HC4 type (RING finger)
MDAPRTVTLRCGHANLCEPCLARLGRAPRCPSCRAPAVRVLSGDRPLPGAARVRSCSSRAHSSHSAASSTTSLGPASRLSEAEVEPTSFDLRTPITGPAAGRPRLVLLMGSRSVPLAALAMRLATEAALAVATAVSINDGAPGEGMYQRYRLRFAFLVTDDSNDDHFHDVVYRIRACSPYLIVLCAHSDRPSTFEHLVKTDLALCAKFGRSAPRSWALVRPDVKSRQPHGTSVDPYDVQNAQHYLGLGRAHVRDTFAISLGRNTRDIRKFHRALHHSVFRKYMPVETPPEPGTMRQQLGSIVGSAMKCYLYRAM